MYIMLNATIYPIHYMILETPNLSRELNYSGHFRTVRDLNFGGK